MARIFSWQLTNDKFVYITGIEKDDNEPFIGYKLTTDEYDAIIDKITSEGAEQIYENNIPKVKDICKEYGVDWVNNENAELATWDVFYDTTKFNGPNGLDFMTVLAGRDGESIVGPQGPKGDKGEDGKTPATPIPYISLTVYASTGNVDLEPARPEDKNVTLTWDENTGYTFEYHPEKGGVKWYLYDSDANNNDGDDSDKSIIWQSSAIYNDQGICPTGSKWSKPIRITGADGVPGADGDTIEFIYLLLDHRIVNENDYIPEYINKSGEDGVPKNGDWTGSAQGIDETNRYEYMWQRRRKSDGNWGQWEGPNLWSRWGDDGKDGDGIEYAYYTTEGWIPEFELPEGININSPEYQAYEFLPFVNKPFDEETSIPVIDENGERVKWSDNPLQIDADKNRAQWVIIRKKRAPENGGKALWGEFTGPTLWSMYGEKGERGVEGLTVFQQRLYGLFSSASDVEVNAPYEVDPGYPWAPARPENKGEREEIWCIEAYLKLNIETEKQELCWYDGSTEEREIVAGVSSKPRWSIPFIQEGKDGRDAVEMKQEIYRCYPDGSTIESIEKPPQQSDENKANESYIPQGWSRYVDNLSDATPICFMWYRERTGQEHWDPWSDWVGPFLYTQKGNQGPAGLDGTDGKDGNGTEYVFTTTMKWDGTEAGKPKVFVNPSDNDKDDDQYLPYLDNKYQARWSPEPQGANQDAPYEWVTSRSKTYDAVNNVTKWGGWSSPQIFAKWGYNGKDGKDKEYIYCYTEKNVKPKIKGYDNTFVGNGSPSNGEGQKDEFLPEVDFEGWNESTMGKIKYFNNNGKKCWFDNAQDTSVDYPYGWECIRTRDAKEQGEDKSPDEKVDADIYLYNYPWSAYENNNVTLHAKYGRDGDQGRPGVAGIAGVHYEMRFIRAKNDENDNVHLYVPKLNAKGDSFDGWMDIFYYNSATDEVTQEWKDYWEKTKHPSAGFAEDNPPKGNPNDTEGQHKPEFEKTTLNETRYLDKTYFPLYTSTIPLSSEWPYYFFVQSRIGQERTYEKQTNVNNNMSEIYGYTYVETLENTTWENPARLTGQQGIQGPEGKRGAILYSAGVYGGGTRYDTERYKKPYVMDPSDRNFYYLAKGNKYEPGVDPEDKSYWEVDPNGVDGTLFNTPKENYDHEKGNWIKMEQYDVILANVGIFRTCLVGNGVFYDKWFYSQNGYLTNGDKSETTFNSDKTVKVASKYEDFAYDTKIVYDATNKRPKIEWGKNNGFRPMMALNLLDGSGWFSNGNFLWDGEGHIYTALGSGGLGVSSDGNFPMTWDNDNIYIHKNLKMDSGVTISWGNVDSSAYEKTVTDAIASAQTTADNATKRMNGWVADGVISKLELQGIKDEKVFIIADKNDIDTKCTTYKIAENNSTRSGYTTAQKTYLTALNAIINGFTGNTENVSAGNLSKSQETYYTKRTAILGKIAETENSAITTAKTAYKNDVAQKLGYVNYDDMVSAYSSGNTIISGGVINTGLIDVKTLVAQEGFIDNLSVKQLNTSGTYGKTDKGIIRIEGNKMEAFNDYDGSRCLVIDGDNTIDIPNNITLNTSFSCSYSDTTIHTSGETLSFTKRVSTYNTIHLKSYADYSGSAYVYTTNNPSISVGVTNNATFDENYNSYSNKSYAYRLLLLSDKILTDDEIDSIMTNHKGSPCVSVGTSGASASSRGSISLKKYENGNVIYLEDVDLSNNNGGKAYFNIKQYITPGYTYYLYALGELSGSYVVKGASATLNVVANLESVGGTLSPSCNLTVVGGNGLFYIKDNKNYFKMTKDSFEVVINDDYGIKISNGGYYKRSTYGNWTTWNI